MPWVAKDLGVNLSVSLHAPRDSLRSQIMSINKTYPLNVLMDACKQFTIESPCATRRITFEYAMLAGVNDSEREAAELVSLIKNLPSPLINLIPFNQWPGSRYKCSPESQIKAFKDYLWSHGLDTTVRKSRGDDIMAACGQLRSLDSASKSNSTSSEGSHTRTTLGPRTINGVQF